MSVELSGAQARAAVRRVAVEVDFDRYAAARYESLVRTALLLTQDWGRAEDLVQTTLVKCWSAWGSIRSGDPTPYVRRVMMNTYFGWWRRARIRPELLTHSTPESADYDRYEAIENAAILEALRRLPKRMCAIIVLRYFEDLSEADTAATLDCSVGTVKSQTHRALARLRLDPLLLASRRSPDEP